MDFQQDLSTLLASAAAGLFIGALLVFLLMRVRQAGQEAREQGLQAQLHQAQAQQQLLRDDLEALRTTHQQLEISHRSQQAVAAEQQQQAQEKITLLQQAELHLKQQFENLAAKIFEQRSAQFDRDSRTRLEGLFNPLKEQLGSFRQQVQQAYETEARERHTLKHEILSLKQLNEQLSQDALNLTRALKGDSKQQGNWGEVILSRVLEESGLREGHEYSTQSSHTTDEGKRYQPDVIVQLPEGKQVIIDAKVSLTAYERFCSAEEDSERAAALSDHCLSLRNHIKGLGKKDYQELPGIQSLDYVLMFVPVEAAFLTAIEQQPELVQLALENNIMLVSPTNLLVALRTIHNIWRYEYQNRNAQQIAEKAAALYDKFRLFTEELQKVGKALDQAQSSYDTAMKRLSSGRGNLVRQAEGFRKLGVGVKKPLAEALREQALELPDQQELTQSQDQPSATVGD